MEKLDFVGTADRDLSGKPVLFVGIGVLVSGIIAIIVKNHSIPTAAFFLVIISGITGLWLHKIQKSFQKF